MNFGSEMVGGIAFYIFVFFGIADEKEQDIKYWTEPGNKCL